LRKYWGYDKFLAFQKQAMESACRGRDSWGRDIDDLGSSRSERTLGTSPEEFRNKPKSLDSDSVKRSRAGDSEPAKQFNERGREEDVRRREDPAYEQRERITTRDRTYILNQQDLESMEEIGKFKPPISDDRR
jgi:hypothetical protein